MSKTLSPTLVKKFEEMVEKVDFSQQSKKFLLKLYELLVTNSFSIKIPKKEFIAKFKDFYFTTGTGGYEEITETLYQAYEQDPAGLIKQITEIIEWTIKVGKPITIDVLFEIITENVVPTNVTLSSEQKTILDLLIKNMGRTEREVYIIYNKYRRNVLGKPEVTFSTFLNHVHSIKKKLFFQIIPSVDYYRLGLYPLGIILWLDKGEFNPKLTIEHPYMRYSSVLFEDYYKKLVFFAVVPPRENVFDVIKQVRQNKNFEYSSFYAYLYSSYGINSKQLSRMGKKWDLNEEYIENLLTYIPLDFLEDLDIRLPNTFDYWHEWNFFKERGKRILDLDLEKILVLKGLWKATGTNRGLRVNPNAVKKWFETDYSLSYQKIKSIIDEFVSKKVIQWRPQIRLMSTRILTILLENPSLELLVAIKNILLQVPNFALLATKNIERPLEEMYFIEINIPKKTSLPTVFNEFLSKHQEEIGRFIVSTTVKRVPSQIDYVSLWDIKNCSWIWNEKIKFSIHY